MLKLCKINQLNQINEHTKAANLKRRGMRELWG